MASQHLRCKIKGASEGDGVSRVKGDLERWAGVGVLREVRDRKYTSDQGEIAQYV